MFQAVIVAMVAATLGWAVQPDDAISPKQDEDPRKVFTVEDGMLHILGDGLGYICTKNRYRGAEGRLRTEIGFDAFQPAVVPRPADRPHIHDCIGTEIDLSVRPALHAVYPRPHDQVDRPLDGLLECPVGLGRAAAEQVVPPADHEDRDVLVLVGVLDDVVESPELIVPAVIHHLDQHVTANDPQKAMFHDVFSDARGVRVLR